MENNFNVNDWLSDPVNYQEEPIKELQPILKDASTVELDIDRIVKVIETNHIDLTSDYKDWITIGFAFAHELGEMGRDYFQRVSRFYPQYDPQKTDKQFDSCLKRNSNGVTIKSFFYLAKNANIKIGPDPDSHRDYRSDPGVPGAKPAKEENPELITQETSHFNTPLLPDEIYSNLPRLLTECCSMFSEGIEKDIVLLSAITVLSGCLPNIQGTYFNRRLSAHLYLFITGPSASGKGTMVWSRYLGQSIHEEMFINSAKEHLDYLKELEDYENLQKKQKVGLEKPEAPYRKMLYLPANSSSAALTQLLAENEFTGIIFESEADTLSNTAKQDWGDSSDIFRKAFHHENTSMARRLNKELIEIKNPHLAICLSGTPRQVINLMPEVENGLFSRFMYYAFEDSRGFLNPFVSYKSDNYENFFTKKSYEVHHFYDRLKKSECPIIFKLTDQQGERFTKYFQNLLDKNKMLLSRDLDANTKRLGVITFRIAMVLSALRLMDIEPGTKYPLSLTCSDLDFNTALTIASTLESHAVAVYQQMPKNIMKGLRLAFYEKLPMKFDRKTYLAVAKDLGIAEKTAEKYISLFNAKLLDHQYNDYTKIII